MRHKRFDFTHHIYNHTYHANQMKKICKLTITWGGGGGGGGGGAAVVTAATTVSTSSAKASFIILQSDKSKICLMRHILRLSWRTRKEVYLSIQFKLIYVFISLNWLSIKHLRMLVIKLQRLHDVKLKHGIHICKKNFFSIRNWRKNFVFRKTEIKARFSRLLDNAPRTLRKCSTIE